MIEIQIKRQDLLALHSCLTIVLNKGIPQPSDAALLLECLSDIAPQDKQTAKEFKLKFKQKQLIPCWHCCNIVLNNNLQKDHVHATEIAVIMGKLAIEIDQNSVMNKHPAVVK